ncbi:DUF4442 domain-containing protein [Vogesella sp. LIG4]|uniref:DUF4442 domain-containing protein n=1 Tax=Vogesella sp. LIG4 TaxID=1192162 RepID=UPI00081FF224|nr:DUF4442 domain-containing protein [Vogesella sp. LIG4]SCK06364.1 Acyl-coenzyme A thioesterase PaaI, contains HGG motif [Vogesella sp. LIG4]
MHHRLAKFVFNLWPPFLGAGIRVGRIAPDWRQVDVRLRLGLTNRNYVGVHYGGSLYSMTDPFFMLMTLKNLGRDYIVWDKAGSIDYIKPGRGTVSARFRLDEAWLQAARAATADGSKHLPQLTVDITDRQGELVARVHKTLYIRRKQPH